MLQNQKEWNVHGVKSNFFFLSAHFVSFLNEVLKLYLLYRSHFRVVEKNNMQDACCVCVKSYYYLWPFAFHQSVYVNCCWSKKEKRIVACIRAESHFVASALRILLCVRASFMYCLRLFCSFFSFSSLDANIPLVTFYCGRQMWKCFCSFQNFFMIFLCPFLSSNIKSSAFNLSLSIYTAFSRLRLCILDYILLFGAVNTDRRLGRVSISGGTWTHHKAHLSSHHFHLFSFSKGFSKVIWNWRNASIMRSF